MKNILKIIVILAFLTLSGALSAQTPADPCFYMPDRPGVSVSPYLVGVNQIDFATSFGYNYYSDPYCKSNLFYNTNTFRYGMFKHLEIRAEVDFGTTTTADTVYGGLKGVLIGAKVPLIIGKKNAPDISLFGSAYLPLIGNMSYAPTNYTPAAALLIAKGIGNFYIQGNAGVFWDAYTAQSYSYLNPYTTGTYAQGSYGLYIAYMFGKLGVFVETYGYYSSHNKPYSACDAGLYYLFTPTLQLDVSGGVNYITGIDNSFLNAGIAWRIPSKHCR